MIKLKVSYENEEELKHFLLIIKDKTKNIKLSKNNEGKFKKAYITMKDHIHH